MSSLARDSRTAEQIAAFGAEWLPGEPLGEHTSLGVGGPADIVRVHDCERLPELVAFLRQRDVPWKVLGGGSNLLVADEGLREVLIHLARGEASSFEGNRAEVPAAANLGSTVMECARRNLGGMEGLVGVPGSVGGALRMNAGAYGTEISDAVRSLKVYRGSTGQIETLNVGKIRFEYRHSSLAPDDILLSVSLELPERPYEEIVERVKQCNQKRRASQPINEKSAGCVFKNPPGLSSGKMIDGLGLKGMRVGGAVVSERHANFIVNRHHATASDILRLMELIRARILKAYGVELEEEIIVWRG
jgi:UDP-N-acetylmuramate dehydrogenase